MNNQIISKQWGQNNQLSTKRPTVQHAKGDVNNNVAHNNVANQDTDCCANPPVLCVQAVGLQHSCAQGH